MTPVSQRGKTDCAQAAVTNLLRIAYNMDVSYEEVREMYDSLGYETSGRSQGTRTCETLHVLRALGVVERPCEFVRFRRAKHWATVIQPGFTGLVVTKDPTRRNTHLLAVVSGAECTETWYTNVKAVLSVPGMAGPA